MVKKGVSKFELLGQVKIKDEDKSFQLDLRGKNNKDYIYSQLDFGVDCSTTNDPNIIYNRMMGGYNSKKPLPINVFGKKKNDNGNYVTDYEERFSIEWKDRLTSPELEEVGFDSFITIGIEKNENNELIKKQFIHEYDAIAYLKKVLKNDMIVAIRGNLKYSSYKGETKQERVIKAIYLCERERKEFRAIFEQSIILDKDSKGDIDEDGLLPIYGFVVDYYKEKLSKEKGKNVCYPFNLFLDTKSIPKYDLVFKNFLKPKSKDGIIIVGVQGEWNKGNATVNITKDDLTDEIKDMIECGLISEEDALGEAIGKNKATTKTLFKNILRKKNDNGAIIPMVDDSHKQDELEYFVDNTEEEKAEKEDKTTLNPLSEADSKYIDDIFGEM